MAQWVNRLWNNIFINVPPLPILCEISGALHLVQLGLTAGRLAGWLAGWLAGQLAGRRNTGTISKFSKLVVGRNIRHIASFNQGTASLQPY